MIPVPKPRSVGLTAGELRRAERSRKRAVVKEAEEKKKAAEKMKRLQEKLAKLESEERTATNSAAITAMKTKLKKYEEKLATETAASSTTQVKCFGEKIDPDFESGKKVELEMTEQECMWDEPINYELQVCFRWLLLAHAYIQSNLYLYALNRLS